MTPNAQAFTVAPQTVLLRKAPRPLFKDLVYGPIPLHLPAPPVTSVIGGSAEAKQLVDIWQNLRLGPAEPAEWTAFLDGLESDAVGVSNDHAERVRAVWRELRLALGARLALPQAAAGEDGQLTFSWSRPDLYAEIEVHRDGSHEWFARDRRSDQHSGSAGPEDGPLDARLLKVLARVGKG